MGGILSYSGIVTKARAMESRLLSREDYEKISAMESVADFIGFLKGRQGYRELFKGREENSFHRNEIEGLLNYSLYQDYGKLYRFCSQKQREILKLVFWRMETDYLKECLHRIAGGKGWENLSEFTAFLERHSEVDMEAVRQAEDAEGFVAALKGSAYERVFRELEEQNQLKLHPMEERLDIYCFIRIWKAIEKNFKGKDKKALMDVFGKQIDLLNILWIYRSKRYYGSIEPEELPALIPVCYKLHKEEFKELAGCYTVDEFLHVLEGTYYSELKEEASVEQFYKDNLEHAYRENCKKYPYSMSAVYNLLYHKSREIDRLTTALECIRYQMDSNMAIEYILQE